MVVSLIQTIIIRKQGKLLLKYDNCLKKQGNMGRLMFLANYAKTCGHDMIIDYSTINDSGCVSFYKNGWEKSSTATYAKLINDDETFEEAIKDLERLIK